MFAELMSFQGRIGRGSYWLIGLLQIAVVVFAFMFFGTIVALARILPTMSALLTLPIIIASIVGFGLLWWIGLCANIKRWHDRNKSGWWNLISFVPFIGPTWMWIELGFCRGSDEDNNYGPPPGTAARQRLLGLEIEGMAVASSSRLAKVDDNYLANYAREAAIKQATQQMAAVASFLPAAPAKPSFGKR